MALRWMDGFNDYNSDALGAQKWTSFNASLTVSSTNARNGNSVKATNVNQNFTKTLDSQGTWIIGFGFRTDAAFSVQRTLVRLIDSATVQCALALNPDGTLQVVRGSATAINASGTSVTALSTNTWYYIEWKVTIADSIGANSCKVRLNGTDIITVDSGQDLKAGSNTTANVIHFLDTQNTSVTGAYYDDIYVLDGTGSSPTNDFLGDVKVETLFPNGNGNYSEWDGSDGNQTDNYLLVDESNSNGDTDYVETSTVDDRDSYAFGNLSNTPTAIYGIQFNLRARKTDAGTRTLKPLVRISSTDYLGAGANLPDTFTDQTEIMALSPATASAWSASEINAAEYGIKLTA